MFNDVSHAEFCHARGLALLLEEAGQSVPNKLWHVVGSAMTGERAPPLLVIGIARSASPTSTHGGGTAEIAACHGPRQRSAQAPLGVAAQRPQQQERGLRLQSEAPGAAPGRGVASCSWSLIRRHHRRGLCAECLWEPTCNKSPVTWRRCMWTGALKPSPLSFKG